MHARVAHVLETLRSTLWLVPGSMSLGAALLALLMLHFDVTSWSTFFPEPVKFNAGPEAARALLSTLAGAMITVTGVTFSITIVALSLASQQLGPRLLRNFLRDRVNQFVLGTFLATFVYSLLVLQAVEAGEEAAAVPRVSVTVAVLFALAALAVLIYFIHHVAHGIQADTVINGVAGELEAGLDRLYPEHLGHGPEPETPPVELPDGFDREAVTLRAEANGYLQALETEELIELARRHDLVVRLLARPGDFVVEGSPMLRAWPPARASSKVLEEARRLLIVGGKRTPEQDVEFTIDQLVEVAVRALSPGLNDPFTAMRCVDRLGAALCRVAGRRLPSSFRHDAEGRLRVVAHRSDLPGLVDAAFDQIRQYGASSVAVTVRLLETIEVVAGCAGRQPELRRALAAQADRVLESARSAGHTAADFADIEARYRDAVEALESGTGADGVAMQPRKRSR